MKNVVCPLLLALLLLPLLLPKLKGADPFTLLLFLMIPNRVGKTSFNYCFEMR
jgi:hypothetical protein